MAKTFYLPHDDLGKADWLTNYAARFAEVFAIFGFVLADSTAVNNDSAMFTYMLNNATTFKEFSKSWVDYKDTLRSGPIGTPFGAPPALPIIPAAPTTVNAGIFRRIGAQVQTIKKHSAYNTTYGELLGIIGTENSFDPDTFQTTLTSKVFSDHIRLDFVKSKTEGVNIYTRLKGTATWTFLARDTHTPYNDSRALAVAGVPETREYYARGVIDDVEIGVPSDIKSVVFG
jgi:hypothetical protein